MRIMAVDYGDVRTGLAISDPSGLLTGRTAVVQGRKMESVLATLKRVVDEHDVGEIVVGLPKNMDGTEGPRAELCREFAGRLKVETGKSVFMWDERRTTVEAHGILHANGRKMKNHKQNVDAVAASLILEGYLNWKRRDT